MLEINAANNTQTQIEKREMSSLGYTILRLFDKIATNICISKSTPLCFAI